MSDKNFEYWEVFDEHAKKCNALEELLEPTSIGSSGLCRVTLTNIETGFTRISRIVYKKTTKDISITLNFCPFCGMRIFRQDIICDLQAKLLCDLQTKLHDADQLASKASPKGYPANMICFRGIAHYDTICELDFKMIQPIVSQIDKQSKLYQQIQSGITADKVVISTRILCKLINFIEKDDSCI